MLFVDKINIKLKIFAEKTHLKRNVKEGEEWPRIEIYVQK